MRINRYWADQVRPKKRPFTNIEEDDHDIAPNAMEAYDPAPKVMETRHAAALKAIETRYNAAVKAVEIKMYRKEQKRVKVYLTSDSSNRSALTSTRGSLCQRCQSIDLDAALECANFTGEVSRIIELGTLSTWSLTCMLCRQLRKDALSLLRSMREETGSGSSNPNTDGDDCVWELRRCSAQYLNMVQDKKKVACTTTHLPAVVLCPASWSCSPDQKSFLHLRSCAQMILPTSQSLADLPSTYFDGSSHIVCCHVDFAMVRTWLARCKNEHHCSITSLPEAPHLDRVIDCRTRELVLWSGQEYVALSYVWGTRSRVTIEEDQRTRTSLRLPSSVPRTIDDAIVATLEIGKQFLWVDRYCVDQFHSPQKAQQINTMADVYEQATMTIVALSEDADVGLYGMSAPRENDQIVLQTSTRTYASTLPNLQRCFEGSVYKTRAWTYQEAALSRRCLIFASTQVHFTCRSLTICESLPLPFAKRWRACLRNPSALPWSRTIELANSYRRKIEWLNSSIREFLLRRMTYEADALNAFRGILARSQLLTFYGLPIQHRTNHLDENTGVARVESVFLQSLLWIQDRTAQSALLPRHSIEDVSNSKPPLSPRECLNETSQCRTDPDHSSVTKHISEKSPGRKEGMPTWTWVSCKSHDIDILSSTMLYAQYGKTCYSVTVAIKDSTGSVQITPWEVRYVGSTVSEAISLLSFEDACVIRGIDPRPLMKHFRKIISAEHFTSPSSQFKMLDGTQVLCGRTDTFWMSPRGGIWVHIDREAGMEMEAITAGEATLNAILLEVRSHESLTLKDGLPCSIEKDTRSEPSVYVIYNFLLVCQRGSQHATRVGVLRLTLWLGLESINPKALSRGCLTLA